MGCFPTCFTSKRRLKHHNSIKPTLSEHPREIEDQVDFCAKKSATFDLKVKASEESPAKKDGSFDLVEKNEDEKKSGKDKTFKEIEPLFDSTTLSNMVSLNPNNRYQGCRNSTDECEDKGLQVSDFEEEEEDDDIDDSEPSLAQEESSESLFSLSIDSRKQVCDTEKGENEVNSRMLPCSVVNDEVKVIGGLCGNSGKKCRFGDSVLNPIENLSQWKKVKQRATTQQHKQHRDKENVGFVPDLRSINNGAKPKLCETKPAQQQIGVDTSLSSWLVGCEDMDIANSGDSSVENPESEIANSPGRPKNEEILGDLASDGFNQCSTRSRSQSSSDEKTPIKGTVWSYWVRTGQDMESDYTSSIEMPKTARQNGKDQKVHFNHDSFQGRLVRALDTSLC